MWPFCTFQLTFSENGARCEIHGQSAGRRGVGHRRLQIPNQPAVGADGLLALLLSLVSGQRRGRGRQTQVVVRRSHLLAAAQGTPLPGRRHRRRWRRCCRCRLRQNGHTCQPAHLLHCRCYCCCCQQNQESCSSHQQQHGRPAQSR